MELSVAEAFIDTLDDLRRRSVLRGTEYDAVQAAGLMRRLLFDNSPLATLANREMRLSLNFRWQFAWVGCGNDILIQSFLMDSEMAGAVLNDTPDLPAPIKPHSGRLQDFLKIVVVQDPRNSTTASAHDLLKHYANRRGGVHVDMREPDNRLLSEALSTCEKRLRNVVTALGRITVTALEPLAAKLYVNLPDWRP